MNGNNDIKKYIQKQNNKTTGFLFPKLEGQEPDRNYLKKRANAKIITKLTAVKLANTSTAKNKNNRDLRVGFWRSYYCNETLIVKNEKLIGSYCKNRWCAVCNRIKTADAISKYLPEIENWKNTFMLTLTIPNVQGKNLKKSVEKMLSEFSKIIKEMREKKPFRKLEGYKIIRKIEITNNGKKGYHPHFHIILNSMFLAISGSNVSSCLITSNLFKNSGR